MTARWNRILSSCVAALVFGLAALAESPQPITDERLRVDALRAIFPKMGAPVRTPKQIDDSWPKQGEPRRIEFPDALAGEPVYRITGAASNEAERCTSENIGTEQFSTIREVRMRLYRWPTGAYSSSLLAVLQYAFEGASPAGSCWSIGLLVRLAKNGGDWRVDQRYLLETTHHSSLQAIQVLDLTGGGCCQLVVESNSGGAGTRDSSLQVFDLSKGGFDEVLSVSSRLEYLEEEVYTQSLDVERTLTSRGQEFCTLKTTLLENGRWFTTPRVTRPCYKRGEGVDLDQIRAVNTMLDPIE